VAGGSVEVRGPMEERTPGADSAGNIPIRYLREEWAPPTSL